MNLASGFRDEPVGQRRNGAVGQFEFDAFDAVEREEDGRGKRGFIRAQHADHFVERVEVDAADAEAGGRDVEYGAPEFFARRIQRDEDDGPVHEGRRGVSDLI